MESCEPVKIIFDTAIGWDCDNATVTYHSSGDFHEHQISLSH